MLYALTRRMLATTDKRLLWNFLYLGCYKGMRSVQKFKKRIKRGDYFPPFLYISIINSCNLRCQGCWVTVTGPRQMIEKDKLNQVITDARDHGNSFFGILGGEPTMHPDLLPVLASHPDCYFQLFTNGHFIDDRMAAEMRRIGNVTPLISIEGSEVVSDGRRGRSDVLNKTLAGLEACTRNRLITGVATSVCQSNLELVSEEWLDRLIELGVHYCWFYTYRPVGADPSPQLALSPEQALHVRRFVVRMRNIKPIGIVDAYWDDKGQALCPAATGISHHIGPWGDIEPCPIIQLATESINDGDSVYDLMVNSKYLQDFRDTARHATRGCIVLERPDLLQELARRHDARDTTHRSPGNPQTPGSPGAAMAELAAMESRSSQHNPGNEVPEEHWMYRFAKKHWFFGFGAYT